MFHWRRGGVMKISRMAYGTGLAAAGLYFAIGCTSTTTGNEGNLDFSYTADDQVTNFNKPIAVGAKLELRVAETGTRRAVEVEDASSDDPGVLDVETFSSDRIIVTGTGDGNALIEVSAKVPDGSVVSDSVNMLGATPEVLKLRHSCTSGEDEAKYFVDTDGVLIGYDMEKSNGQSVIGYGYFPIEVTGDAELSLNESSTDQAHFHFDIGSMPGTATIASTIDETMLQFEVVTIGDVDAVEANPANSLRLHVDETAFFHVWPTVDGVRVCQSEETMTAETSTPDICTVSAVDPPSDQGTLDITGWVKVEGKEFGNCEFTVTYPDAADGAGASLDLTAEVGDFPDSSE
jgi:hypothetical protein